MIDFYSIEDREKSGRPLFSIDAGRTGSAGTRLCEKFQERTGLFIDPYGDTKVLAPHCATLCALMKEDARGDWEDAIRVLDDINDLGRAGLIAVGD